MTHSASPAAAGATRQPPVIAEARWGLYTYSTPDNVRSEALVFSASLQFNGAYGGGFQEGPFDCVMAGKWSYFQSWHIGPDSGYLGRKVWAQTRGPA